MSGTSLDGTDAVLVRFEAERVAALHHHHEPYPAALRDALMALQTPSEGELAAAAHAANAVALHYALTLTRLLDATGIDRGSVRAIGAHGQTVRHRPAEGYSLQLLNGALLAERTGITTVCDFRSRDIAAGGEGAPLVPAFHAAMFGTASPRVVVNIGGMANLTILHAGRAVTGFDCGPGNALLDGWIARHRGDAFDAAGDWAASGTVVPKLLAAMLEHPFVRRTPPKSCGREDFDLAWLDSLPGVAGAEPADVQATLAEFTASGIAQSVQQHAAGTRELLICGGGAHNADLLRRIARQLPGVAVQSTAEHGMDPMHVEAAAFAWLARQRLEGLPGNLPEVTGAAGPRVLGAVHHA